MKSHELPKDSIDSFKPSSRLKFWTLALSSLKFPRFPDLLAWGLILLYIVTFTWLAILRHASFDSSGFDLGIYDQVVWNTLHGRPFFYTTTGQPLLHLSNHASLILLLVAPFYLIHSGPETLLFLQTSAIGLGGLPLFWLAREKLGNADFVNKSAKISENQRHQRSLFSFQNGDFAALSLLAAYLLFPTLQIVNLWDFHPPVLAVGFFMAAFYCLVKHKSGWFLFWAVLAMLCKEQLPLQVAFLGLAAIVMHRDWRLGLTTIAVALTYFFIIMYWVIPANSVTGDHLFIGFYAELGDSPAEIIMTTLTRPDLVLKILLQPTRLQYLFDILTPFAYLPLLGLPILAIGAPSFAINLLSGNTAMHDATGAQYGADVAPWLAWAALYGMVYLRQIMHRVSGVGCRVSCITHHVSRITLSHVPSVLLLAVALVWQLFHGFSPLALDPPRWEITVHDRLAQRFIAQIPPDASIAAQGKLYPHLSNRLIAYQLPDVNEAEYVFFDATTGTWPVHPNDIWALARELLSSGQYGVLDAADGYLLLKRGLTTTDIPNAFYDFARVADPQPQYSLNVEFGDELRLLGFDVLDDPRREETSVRLYWQALRPLDRELRLYPFFVNTEGQMIENTEQRPLLTQLWFPPHLWQPGETIIAETMPWAVGNRWSLAVGVLADNDWSDWSQRLSVTTADRQPIRQAQDEPPTAEAESLASSPPRLLASLRRFEANTWVRLATFERQGRELVEIAPTEPTLQPSNPLQINFDGKMELRGYDAKREGATLAVTLYWQALSAMPEDYTIFVHLIGPDGQKVAQHDGQPTWEVPLPTSTWQPGEVLQDKHILALPANLPPSDYGLNIGVYYWQTLERLPVVENNLPIKDFVAINGIRLE
ncbi:MAG: hypothetical protein DPW09_06500 [Anaerolineae bacterium]|nr:DUF2079 domain-containing protein [Anaerolineales bacterium]MCQ3973086.1 hypothetical protein [Anaerolineae bacterium]